MAEEASRSRYVIFGDESGDHGLNAKSHSRAFVIAFAIFRRDLYEKIARPAVQDFKRRYFGDAQTLLHEREIRKGEGPFRTLKGAAERDEALQDLRLLLEHLPYSIVAVGIDKDRFVPDMSSRGSPYQRRFLEALSTFLLSMPGDWLESTPTEIVVDSRGAKEDSELEQLVNSLTESADPIAASFRFRIRFTRKAQVEIGVEIADLIANPISSRVLGREHETIPFSTLESKFLRHPADQSQISLVILNRE